MTRILSFDRYIGRGLIWDGLSMGRLRAKPKAISAAHLLNRRCKENAATCQTAPSRPRQNNRLRETDPRIRVRAMPQVKDGYEVLQIFTRNRLAWFAGILTL